jgi:hypothetical protein
MKEKPTHYTQHIMPANMQQNTIQTQHAPSSATPNHAANHSTQQAAPKPACREYLCLERQSSNKRILEF